ncbi:hypothetical protein PHJA_002417800 [Phtheirospermum japonicum]|uniref:BolA-like protein n=1 Tax=Phtheirospermum japonicum TaxID=374723 RepID=A0A830CYT8_9LAMI|nr:hypothetical protein PHJA_002417800 [Phtheirospermum japonicum]
MMAALLRPSVTTALSLLRSRGATTISFRRRTASFPILTRRSLFTSSIRATAHSDNPAASFESPLMESMEKKIKEQLSAESVIVKDAYGDGRHVSIEVVSTAFEGQSAVNRQRMVYKAIWEELQERVHAVDEMTTRTPAEVKQQ